MYMMCMHAYWLLVSSPLNKEKKKEDKISNHEMICVGYDERDIRGKGVSKGARHE